MQYTIDNQRKRFGHSRSPGLYATASRFRHWLATLIICSLTAAHAGQALAVERLRIVVAQTAADTGLIGSLADAFRARHPDVSIDIQPAGALATLDLGRRG